LRGAGISAGGLQDDMHNATDMEAPEDMQDENPEDQGQASAAAGATTPAAPGIAPT
jgi:hypothetical protein